jgi:hypothetical protein
MLGSRPIAALGLLAIAASAPAAPRGTTAAEQPQNQSIVNTSKSNTKDFAVAPGDPAASEGINTARSNIKNSFRLAPGDAPLIVTPIEIRFADPAGYDDFAAGRLPVTLVLRNAASGQTIRFDPLVIDLGGAAGRDSVRLDLKIDKVDSALLARGCFETATAAEPRGDGVAITVTYTPCAGGGGPPQPTAPPVPGIGIVVKKHPPRQLIVATGPSEVGGGAEARVAARSAGARQLVVPVSSAKGAGSPKAAGF